MRTIYRTLATLVLGCFVGCDVEEHEPIIEPSELPMAPDQFEEDPPTHATDLNLPSEGICDKGHWDYSRPPTYLGCGTCTNTYPEPDRPGNMAWLYRRWCWEGPGCGGCGQWIHYGTGCYDICQ
jgi:hypothetical protein